MVVPLWYVVAKSLVQSMVDQDSNSGLKDENILMAYLSPQT